MDAETGDPESTRTQSDQYHAGARRQLCFDPTSASAVTAGHGLAPSPVEVGIKLYTQYRYITYLKLTTLHGKWSPLFYTTSPVWNPRAVVNHESVQEKMKVKHRSQREYDVGSATKLLGDNCGLTLLL